MEYKKVYIEPFSEEEFKKMITTKNVFCVYFEKLHKCFKNNHNLSEAELVSLTVRVPREMKLLELSLEKTLFLTEGISSS